MLSIHYLYRLIEDFIFEGPLVRYKLGENYCGAASGPLYATEGAAGCDLVSSAEVTLAPGETALVSTGLFLEIPEGYEMQVRSRSGMALKKNLIVLNSPGTIDSDYRGEVKVILKNLSAVHHKVERGDAVAQGVFARVPRAKFMITSELSSTKRGEGGFGSTGVKRQDAQGRS